MTKLDWLQKIKQASVDAGTYRPFFDSVIDTLAETMELRDDAKEKFYESGGQTVVEHTNKGGATNIVKNPALIVMDDLNKTALSYWRDLGLTPAGLKRIADFKVEDIKEKSALEVALEELAEDKG